MKLYRVEITHDTDFEPGEWSSDLATVKKEYAEKRSSFDEEDYAYEDDSLAIVAIEVPEEVIEEFERDTEVLQKEVVALEPEEDGYTSWYWKKEKL
ncbi:hypothetical protein [uncultured Enterococcus sp.]|uniref:hypothetical protein n=1 Tax=uncultured Enterococcus sp. TaxID=167972 RepID=UPI002AA65BFB|nr:hypothetical protein [uncultured Enterococcus sp.]